MAGNAGAQTALDPNTGAPILVQPTIAAARFTCANPPVAALSEGCASITRNGAGDYTVTLDFPLVAGTFTIQVSALHNAFCNVTFTNPTTTTVRIFTFDAAGAAQEVGSVEMTISRL